MNHLVVKETPRDVDVISEARNRTGADSLRLKSLATSTSKGNKYGAVRTWSELCGRTFDSKAEARRGEELLMLCKAGEILGLEYQPKWVLCENPKITYTADFKYRLASNHERIIEDVKGKLLRETRVKLAWLREKYGIEVKLVK